MTQPLGRRVPEDFEHVEKYPLTAVPRSALVAPQVPVVFGINWYTNFDNPVKVGREYVIGQGDFGRIRGGHAICARPYRVRDYTGWWEFYDQGTEGACVGFACSRMMTLLNRRRYDARWLYYEAQKVDEWPGENYSGTSVRAACDILRTRGHRRSRSQTEAEVEGIETNRWATHWDDVRAALGTPGSVNGVQLMNSWGRDGYPHYVRISDEAGARVLDEYGEIALVTDR